LTICRASQSSAPPVRQREHADHLGKISVRRGADQQAARQITAFLGVPPEPRPRTAAGAERVHLEQRGGIGREASAEDIEIGQSAGIEFGVDGLGEFGLASAIMGERQQPDHGAARPFLGVARQ